MDAKNMPTRFHACALLRAALTLRQVAGDFIEHLEGDAPVELGEVELYRDYHIESLQGLRWAALMAEELIDASMDADDRRRVETEVAGEAPPVREPHQSPVTGETQQRLRSFCIRCRELLTEGEALQEYLDGRAKEAEARAELEQGKERDSAHSAAVEGRRLRNILDDVKAIAWTVKVAGQGIEQHVRRTVHEAATDTLSPTVPESAA